MNEKQAKRLRRALGYKPIYKDRKYMQKKNGMIFCDNPRYSYLRLKDVIREAKRL